MEAENTRRGTFFFKKQRGENREAKRDRRGHCLTSQFGHERAVKGVAREAEKGEKKSLLRGLFSELRTRVRFFFLFRLRGFSHVATSHRGERGGDKRSFLVVCLSVLSRGSKEGRKGATVSLKGEASGWHWRGPKTRRKERLLERKEKIGFLSSSLQLVPLCLVGP